MQGVGEGPLQGQLGVSRLAGDQYYVRLTETPYVEEHQKNLCSDLDHVCDVDLPENWWMLLG